MIEPMESYPYCVVRNLVRIVLPYAIGVEKGPNRELMQDANFLQNVKVGELVWRFVLAERVAMRGLGHILSACVFVEELWATEGQFRDP